VTGSSLLLDTGPWVALVDRSEQAHEECRRFLEGFHGRLLSTEAVLTEALYLLSEVRGASSACLSFVLRGAVTLVPASNESLKRCDYLIGRYADIPMDYADATLVALAEGAGTGSILTLDRRGFGAYRWSRNRAFELLP